MAATKSETAFRTIGELSAELGIAQHILRYWETRFPQLRPLQRAGNRRYYRPADVALAKRIDCWLNQEGLTVKGVQKRLADEARASRSDDAGGSGPPAAQAADVGELRAIRSLLAAALAVDAAG